MESLFANLHYFAVFIASIVMWLFGWIWFSLWGITWKKGMEKYGVQVKKMSSSKRWRNGLLTFLLILLTNIGLAVWVNIFHLTAISCAIRTGLFFGIFFAGPFMLSSYLWENRPMKLSLISIGYPIIGMIFSTVILVLFARG